MRGKLHKTQTGWTVTYVTRKQHNNMLDIGEVPLHPEDIDSITVSYVDDGYNIVHTYDGKNVEIEMETIYEHGECDEHPITYAKIIRHL